MVYVLKAGGRYLCTFKCCLFEVVIIIIKITVEVNYLSLYLNIEVNFTVVPSVFTSSTHSTASTSKEREEKVMFCTCLMVLGLPSVRTFGMCKRNTYMTFNIFQL